MPRDDRADSPQESLGSSESDSKRNTLVAEREVPIHDYKYTVNVGDECIRITGASLDLVRTAKLVLDEYFSLEGVNLNADTHIEDMIVPPQNPSPLNSKESKSESIDQKSVTVIRQPLFPAAPKSAFAAIEPNSASISARRAMFAKTAKDVELKDESLRLERSTSASTSKPEISYDRYPKYCVRLESTSLHILHAFTSQNLINDVTHALQMENLQSNLIHIKFTLIKANILDMLSASVQKFKSMTEIHKRMLIHRFTYSICHPFRFLTPFEITPLCISIIALCLRLSAWIEKILQISWSIS